MFSSIRRESPVALALALLLGAWVTIAVMMWADYRCGRTVDGVSLCAHNP